MPGIEKVLPMELPPSLEAKFLQAETPAQRNALLSTAARASREVRDEAGFGEIEPLLVRGKKSALDAVEAGYTRAFAIHTLWMASGRIVLDLDADVVSRLLEADRLWPGSSPRRAGYVVRLASCLEVPYVDSNGGFAPLNVRVMGAYLWGTPAKYATPDIRDSMGVEEDDLILSVVEFFHAGGEFANPIPLFELLSFDGVGGPATSFATGELRDRSYLWWNLWCALGNEQVAILKTKPQSTADQKAWKRGAPRYVKSLRLGEPANHVLRVRRVSEPEDTASVSESRPPIAEEKEAPAEGHEGSQCFRVVPAHRARHWVRSPNAGEEVLSERTWRDHKLYLVWRTRKSYSWGNPEVPRKTPGVLVRVKSLDAP